MLHCKSASSTAAVALKATYAACHGTSTASMTALPNSALASCICLAGHPVGQRNPYADAMMIDAMFAAIDDPQHCQHILKGTHSGPKDLTEIINALCHFVHNLDVKNGLQQITQLNTLACLLMLCRWEREFSSRPDWRPKGAVAARPWYHEAERQNALSCQQGPFGMALVAQAFGVCASATACVQVCVQSCVSIEQYHQPP